MLSPSSEQAAVRETLARMDDAWAGFHDRVRSIRPEKLELRIANGSWTRKQMLAHIATWHDRTVEALTDLVESQAVPGPTEDTDVINARAARAAVGRTTGEILFGLDDSYRVVHRAVSRLTDEQLMAHDGWAAAMIAGNTYDHYAEHIADLAG